MRNPYREPAERAIATTNRIPGRVLVGVSTAIFALVSIALFLGTRRTVQSVAVLPPPAPVITNLPDGPEVLYEGGWPDYDVTLLGIDAKKKEAVLKLVSHKAPDQKLVYGSIDYEHHAITSQWEVSDRNLHDRIEAYPPEFGPIDGDFTTDLVRMGRLARLAKGSAFPFGLDPMMAVDPSSGAIVYDQTPKGGHDGDNLFMVDADGKNPRRIDEGLVASYDPMFSPDGQSIAMRSCGHPCKYFLHLVDPKKRVPMRIAQVVEPRSYAWSPDSTKLWVLSRPTGDQAVLYRVDRNGKVTEIFRSDAMHDAELEVAADGSVAVIASRGHFVFVDLARERVFRERPLDLGTLMSVGPNGVLFSSDRAGVVAYDPHTEKQVFYPDDGWYLQPFFAAWEAPGVVIAVRTKGSAIQLVRLRVGARL